MWIKFGVIWLHRLEDYNVLVEKRFWNFPKNTFGGEIQFLNLFEWKNFEQESTSKTTWKHTGERKCHSIHSLCLQNCLEMLENNKKK